MQNNSWTTKETGHKQKLHYWLNYVQIKVNCIHNNRHCENTRVRPSAMTIGGGRPGQLRLTEKLLVRIDQPGNYYWILLLVNGPRSNLRYRTGSAQCCSVGHAATPPSCPAVRSRVWPQRLPSHPTLTIKVEAAGCSETPTQFTTRRRVCDETESIRHYKLPKACLCSSWIY